ncbi:hypothetical protein QYF36_003226 [Acer negundo]|nr:hypothetical protein QYF36_003226 [Acer negundo]
MDLEEIESLASCTNCSYSMNIKLAKYMRKAEPHFQVAVYTLHMFGVALRVTTRVILVSRRQLPSLFGKPSSTLQPNPVPQSITYQDLFSQLKSPPDIFEAKKLHALLVVHGFFNSTSTDRALGSQLVNVYVNFGCLREALVLFDKLPNKSSNLAWNAILRGFIDMGEFSKTVHFYHSMLRQGPVPDNFTYPLVLKACSGSNDLEQGRRVRDQILFDGVHRNMKRNVYVECAMIDMFANRLEDKQMGMVLQGRVIRSGFESDLFVSNALIDMYSFELFRRLRDSNLKPNSITLVSILPMCTKIGSLRLGKEIHSYATRSGLSEVISVGNSIIDMYCKCGYLELGSKVFNQMVDKNIVTYNTIISAHGIHGRGHEAFTLFEQMKEARIRPNKVTFVALLSACSHSGRLQDACNFIRSMPVEPDIDVLGSLLGACRVHNKIELAELVKERILVKDQNDPGFFVLLSNIYASTNRWKDALKVRNIIKEKGLVKKPANSWIQIGSSIHVFHARERMHPEFDKIQEMLDNLLSDMKNISMSAENHTNC